MHPSSLQIRILLVFGICIPIPLSARSQTQASSAAAPGTGILSPEGSATLPAGFSLSGLVTPATVAETILVAAPILPAGSTLTYLLDNQPAAVRTVAPYWMGPLVPPVPGGFSLNTLTPGTHQLSASALAAGAGTSTSASLILNVIPSLNHSLSSTLATYDNHPSAQQNSIDTMLQQTSTPGAILTATETAVRRQVLAMYKNWGIDPSLDAKHDQSALLLSLNPRSWAPPPVASPSTPLSMLFSPDAPFYHAIPALWPRVALPSGYMQKLQLNTNQQGDGIGFGEVVAHSTDSVLPVRSQWFDNQATFFTFLFPMPTSWATQLPSQATGDLHMIFVAPTSGSTALSLFTSSYKTTVDPRTGGPDALAASPPTPLDSLGDHGGSTAAGFAELPAMIQPGEATNPTQPIRHALGGSVSRVWAARVYPASAWDGGLKTSINSCTGQGFTNTGLVPYGGVLQLDPALDLTLMPLTLPARRILEAFQTFGYYVMDFGCADLDIYTAIPETELDPFGGLWGYNKKGLGVQNEVESVLLKHTLYVVAPLLKKQ